MNREHNYPLQPIIGVMLTIGGLWHAAAPWIFVYSSIRAAVISDMAAGLTLAVVGLGYIILHGAWWLDTIAAAIGVWVLMAPQLLGFAGPQFTELEATWGGPITIVLAIIASLERQFDSVTDYRAAGRVESGVVPA